MRRGGEYGISRINAAKTTRSRGTRAAGSPPCRARDVARLPTAPRTRAPQAMGARAGASAAPLSAARKSSCAQARSTYRGNRGCSPPPPVNCEAPPVKFLILLNEPK